MPYRALFRTIVTVALAFLAVGMWVRAVEPLLVEAQAAATQPAGAARTRPAANSPQIAPPPEKGLSMLIRGTLLLSFLLICMLLLVGIFSSFREWVRYQTTASERRKRSKTKYVDAWKLAGERMPVNGSEEEEKGEDPSSS
jgi:uncharacterized membrane protein YidH (DUF202 family)